MAPIQYLRPKERKQAMFNRILVAIDGSPASEKALTVAVDLAIHYKADLTAIGVVEVPEIVGTMDEVDELRESAEDHFRQLSEAAVEFARSRGIVLRSVVVRGHAADAIVHYAESEQMNLVVLGHRGHSRITRFFLGSTTDRVSAHCSCSVVIVK
jgi:nucleotide-binding universal stress UspA family protein